MIKNDDVGQLVIEGYDPSQVALTIIQLNKKHVSCGQRDYPMLTTTSFEAVLNSSLIAIHGSPSSIIHYSYDEDRLRTSV
ncbi:Uncharacterised protein [Propionibacterium australiense]|uniref:Uncharacterized protein n=1 Tax=Propionibacterium australiense TaxID=119981 RepID=A0A383S7F4_9ACTN|nr:Hypothetical protein PROPAUS_1093 [Propionibacterium australiense]VEH89388.1 Uncharacterised protein [Propionibacterium australiense]